MRMILLTWDYHGQARVADAFARLGYQAELLPIDPTDITANPAFRARLTDLLREGKQRQDPFLFVFSHDFFPVAAEVCEAEQIPYLSLVYDSPHYSLTSPAIDNGMSRAYVFDRGLLAELAASGITAPRHALLSVDPGMAEQTAALSDLPYAHDVSFIGTLYQSEYVFYNQIKYLPPALHGYLDGVIKAQEQVFGYDMIGDPAVVPEKKIEEMAGYVQFDLTGEYRLRPADLLRDILRKKVTSVERSNILARLGRAFPVDLYTTPTSVAPAGVRNLGYADYDREMPRIFHRSRININITLRTIRTGIPLRAMDIMACGGFLLSDYREELAEFFTDGEDLALAHTPEEFAELTAYYLEHEEEREAIARNGQRKVLENYTHDKVFARMIAESVG
ncbi:MAG: glycosyltransferase [Lachnospiraceae bacterium]|nr:glycosyltransferase [Lachnospiraceae bacterium]